MKFIVNHTLRLSEWQNTKRLANWLTEREGWSISEPYVAIGAENNQGKIVCVSVFNNFNNRDIEWTAAGKFTRGMLRVSLDYMFDTCACRRATMRVKASNHHCLKSLMKLGARVEGRLRHYYDENEDALVLGLLKEDCKYVQHF